MLFLAGTTLISMIGILVFYIFYAIGGYRIFTKCGEAGWKAFIPFYNTYIQYRLTWKPIMAIPAIVLPILSSQLSAIADGNTMLSVLTLIFGLAGTVVMLLGNIKLSKSFGHGVGYGLGLYFLQPIFIMILGFGSDEYIGNTTKG